VLANGLAWLIIVVVVVVVLFYYILFTATEFSLGSRPYTSKNNTKTQ